MIRLIQYGFVFSCLGGRDFSNPSGLVSILMNNWRLNGRVVRACDRKRGIGWRRAGDDEIEGDIFGGRCGRGEGARGKSFGTRRMNIDRGSFVRSGLGPLGKLLKGLLQGRENPLEELRIQGGRRLLATRAHKQQTEKYPARGRYLTGALLCAKTPRWIWETRREAISTHHGLHGSRAYGHHGFLWIRL